jgi:hypothetical protein
LHSACSAHPRAWPDPGVGGARLPVEEVETVVLDLDGTVYLRAPASDQPHVVLERRDDLLTAPAVDKAPDGVGGGRP